MEVDPRGRVIGALSYVGCELCSIMFYHFSDIFEEEKALATFENKCCWNCIDNEYLKMLCYKYNIAHCIFYWHDAAW